MVIDFGITSAWRCQIDTEHTSLWIVQWVFIMGHWELLQQVSWLQQALLKLQTIINTACISLSKTIYPPTLPPSTQAQVRARKAITVFTHLQNVSSSLRVSAMAQLVVELAPKLMVAPFASAEHKPSGLPPFKQVNTCVCACACVRARAIACSSMRLCHCK